MGALKQMMIEETENVMKMLEDDGHVVRMTEDAREEFFEGVEIALFHNARSRAGGLMRVGWEYASDLVKYATLRDLLWELPDDEDLSWLETLLEARKVRAEDNARKRAKAERREARRASNR